jgi:hypothetical protein
MEKWKPIAEFDGIYEVSDFGRVRRAVGGRGTRAGRLTKIGKDVHGYRVVMISIKCKKYLRKIHRLVAQAFIPNPKNLPEVNHDDGNKRNNLPSNLEWCLHPDNQQHAAENGLMAKGSRNGTSKLTEKDITAIRQLGHRTGVSIAAEYKVSSATISVIRSRKVWKHV